MNWIKSSHCNHATCVEVAMAENGYFIMRNTEDPDKTMLTFTPNEWEAFLAGVKNGEFDMINLTENP